MIFDKSSNIIIADNFIFMTRFGHINFAFSVQYICMYIFLFFTGWIRSKVRDPERVAGHMFRMALMSVLLEEEGENHLPDVTKYEILLFMTYYSLKSLMMMLFIYLRMLKCI